MLCLKKDHFVDILRAETLNTIELETEYACWYP